MLLCVFWAPVAFLVNPCDRRRAEISLWGRLLTMIIDFQHHYTPPALIKGRKDSVSVGIDENGNPMHLLNPLLGDIDAHVRMTDAAGIDAAVLSSLERISARRLSHGFG